MRSAVAIGIDIGGTTTKGGLISRDGHVLARLEQNTPPGLSTAQVVDAITSLLNRLVAESRTRDIMPLGVGISVCGYLDSTGRVPEYVNLRALQHFPIVDHLEGRFGLSTVIDNDMNCGVLGEYRHGAGQGVDRLMVMTVGTGIGMSMTIDGKVFSFNAGTVGNPGHVIVSGDGPVCPAGCRGCVESLASAGPISRLAEDVARSNRATLLRDVLAQRGSLSPEDLFHAAEAGDEPARAIWNEVGGYLGRGLASWVAIFGPEMVVVGGGVALAGHWLVDPLEQEMRRVGDPYFVAQVHEVRLSPLGKDSAMHGAASLVLWPEDAPRGVARTT